MTTARQAPDRSSPLLEDYSPHTGLVVPIGLVLSAAGLAGGMGRRARQELLDPGTVLALYSAAAAADPFPGRHYPRQQRQLGVYWRDIAAHLCSCLPGPWTPEPQPGDGIVLGR